MPVERAHRISGLWNRAGRKRDGDSRNRVVSTALQENSVLVKLQTERWIGSYREIEDGVLSIDRSNHSRVVHECRRRGCAGNAIVGLKLVAWHWNIGANEGDCITRDVVIGSGRLNNTVSIEFESYPRGSAYLSEREARCIQFPVNCVLVEVSPSTNAVLIVLPPVDKLLTVAVRVFTELLRLLTVAVTPARLLVSATCLR